MTSIFLIKMASKKSALSLPKNKSTSDKEMEENKRIKPKAGLLRSKARQTRALSAGISRRKPCSDENDKINVA